MALGDYFSQPMLEARASRLLLEYVKRCGVCQVPPVPVEDIAERFLDLGLLWDEVPEPPGCVVLAKIVPAQRLIVFNEAHRDRYERTPNLERTTLAHEIGHWELHLERGTVTADMPLPGSDHDDALVYQRDPSTTNQDEQNAHSFMGCLLMPKEEVIGAVRARPVRHLTDMYDLARLFGVTITALQIRLGRLGLAYVDSQGKVHESRQAALGQLSFC